MNTLRLILVYFLDVTFHIGSEALGPTVKTTHGIIEGFTETVNGVNVDVYLGIPFANPPMGDLRFRAPQPADKWTGVRETKVQPNTCMQLPDAVFEDFVGANMWDPNTNVSEDCLYLNMWVPRANNSQTLIWIYGGGFTTGTITLDVYNGLYLAAKKKLILASIQYRVGAMGFLYSGTTEASGNMGLFDQSLAMKWINDNIEGFGGHRDKITIFGESAGAGSVSHHLLSKLSWPYFSRAIMLSGSSLAEWAVSEPEDLQERTNLIADLMGCSESEGKVKCLRGKQALEIERNNSVLKGRFGPTIDGFFLTDYPAKLLQEGKMKDTDILLGNTNDEGEYFLHYWYPDIFVPKNLWKPVRLNRDQFLDLVCRVAGCQGPLEREAILYVYEKSQLPRGRGNYVDMIDDMLGDSFMKCSVRSLGLLHANMSDRRTYMYSFEYRHSANPWPSWMGALHGYEIELVFGQPFNPRLNYSDLDRTVSSKMMDLLTRFAESGNPNMIENEWPEFTANSEQHIIFSQDGSTYVREGYRTKECTFWEYLLPKLRQQESGSPVTGGSVYPRAGVIFTALLILINIEMGL